MPGVAVRTEGGFGDATTLHLDVGLGLAHRAPEEGFGELGDEVGSPGHHPRDCDELVDVCKKTQIVALNSFKSKGPSSLTLRVEAPHVLGLVRVEGHHLHLVAEDGVGILLEEELVDAHIERRDDFLRVTDELPVEVLVELPDVPRVDVEVGRSKGLDLKELDMSLHNIWDSQA